MSIQNNKPLQILALVLSSTLLLSACNKNDHTQTAQTEQQPPSHEADVDQLKTPPVKEFPATAQDTHDIALLDEFDEKFTAMTDDMDNELAKMQQDGTLTSEFDRNRKLDHIQSALTMLKELDLKTAQGRYIQGLLYQYWENQGKLINEQTSSANAQNQKKTAISVQDLSDYLHAQEQLKHWKDQQKPT
ncbi:hypothetical protein IAE19_13850 [Acinetobacter sp. S40]|uniref:hypothetical protein n=1 Tax=unclassified Acinetobacter TaxID=196816 RepID=UPI00190D5D1A|nr:MULTISPECIES: hypothetical protein [unclassified Acinetobacter]MBJ9986514.1 hypothetical protein [Acinetobacter sp. S40]MBK0064753.1 hypothetical protein [Acinetobacter sp. S55]MBK0068116.1 hypothetical protein [Acinetobacter sp. S54]